MDLEIKRSWYQESDPCDLVLQTFEQLETDSGGRFQSYDEAVRLVGRRTAARGLAIDKRTGNLSLNVVRSVMDTAVALIGTEKPKPFFKTIRGSHKMQQRAKKLNQFALGQFRHCKVYEKNLKIFRDAAKLGDGFGKVFETQDGDIAYERVRAKNLFVDKLEAEEGEPRNLYQYSMVPKSVLYSQYPDKSKAIYEADLIRTGIDSGTSDEERSMVGVVEAWHLPSSDNSTDGRWCKVIRGATLAEDTWEDRDFPFVKFSFYPEEDGFWNLGIPDILKGIQWSINAILAKIMRHLKASAVKIFVQSEGAIKGEKQWNDQEYEVRTYAGSQPFAFSPPAFSPEYLRMLEYKRTQAYELTGFSELSAQAKKQPGLDAGIAIMNMMDIQSARLHEIKANWENFHLDIARRMIELARRIDERGDSEGYKIMADSEDGLEEIKWSEVSLERNKFTIQPWPVNLVPDTPAGKLAYMKELSAAFPAVQPYIGMLLDMPDTEAITEVLYIHQSMGMYISDIIEEGRQPPSPDGYSSPEKILPYVVLRRLKAIKQELPQGVIEAYDNWITQATDVIEPPPVAPGPEPIVSTEYGPEPSVQTAMPPAPQMPMGGPAGPMPGGVRR